MARKRGSYFLRYGSDRRDRVAQHVVQLDGHATIETSAMYDNALGKERRSIAYHMRL